MKNKKCNLSFRANSSFGYGSSRRPKADSHLETNPNSNSNFEFFLKQTISPFLKSKIVRQLRLSRVSRLVSKHLR